MSETHSSHPRATPDWRVLPLAALRAFEATARHGSMTGAAAELNVTHGAVSRQIAALERLIGGPVFERGARGVVLTDMGRQLFQEVGGGFERLRAGLRLAGTAAPEAVRLTTLPSFATRWLLPRLVVFQATHPEIEVRVHSSLDITDLAAGHYDLAVRYGRGGWPGVAAEPLLRGPVFPVCTPELLQRLGGLRDPSDLLRAPLIHNSATERWADWFQEFGVAAPEMPRGPVVDDYALTLEYALGGFGVALGREALVREELARGRLIRPLPHVLTSPFAYFLVWPAARRPHPAAELFAGWLRGVAAEAA